LIPANVPQNKYKGIPFYIQPFFNIYSEEAKYAVTSVGFINEFLIKFALYPAHKPIGPYLIRIFLKQSNVPLYILGLFGFFSWYYNLVFMVSAGLAIEIAMPPVTIAETIFAQSGVS
jgi:hypothetical protein